MEREIGDLVAKENEGDDGYRTRQETGPGAITADEDEEEDRGRANGYRIQADGEVVIPGDPGPGAEGGDQAVRAGQALPDLVGGHGRSHRVKPGQEKAQQEQPRQQGFQL